MSKNKYSLPLKEKDITKIPTNSPAHVGNLKNSVDFTCDEGCEVYSVLSGEIVWVKNDSKVGGSDKKFYYDGNRIVIKHKNNEYSAYEHLKFNGVIVKVGDKVKKGQPIGYSGNTGWSYGPHLHFEVFVFTGPDKTNDFETLKISWDNKTKKVVDRFK